jgi:hypothetical protein
LAIWRRTRPRTSAARRSAERGRDGAAFMKPGSWMYMTEK